MDIVAVLVALAIGAIAGWLAGLLVEGAGFGLLWNILIGIAGAFMAALLFPRLGLGLTLGGGIVGAIVTSTLGAVVLLLIVNLIHGLRVERFWRPSPPRRKMMPSSGGRMPTWRAGNDRYGARGCPPTCARLPGFMACSGVSRGASLTSG